MVQRLCKIRSFVQGPSRYRAWCPLDKGMSLMHHGKETHQPTHPLDIWKHASENSTSSCMSLNTWDPTWEHDSHVNELMRTCSGMFLAMRKFIQLSTSRHIFFPNFNPECERRGGGGCVSRFMHVMYHSAILMSIDGNSTVFPTISWTFSGIPFSSLLAHNCTHWTFIVQLMWSVLLSFFNH